LKEQADEALGVGIKAEGIDVIDVLIDVARKDKNEKYCCDETDDASVLCENYQGCNKQKAESDFN